LGNPLHHWSGFDKFMKTALIDIGNLAISIAAKVKIA